MADTAEVMEEGGLVLALVLAFLYLRKRYSSTAGQPQSNGSAPLLPNLTASAPSAGTRTVSAIADFIAKLGPIAAAVEKETGISAKLGMAEAAEESRYGLSELARPDGVLTVFPSGISAPANNLFGITAEEGTYWRNQNQPYVLMPTHEWVKQADGTTQEIATTRPFRAYLSWDASYRDWARLMQTKNYVDAGALAALKAGDPVAFGQALNKAGYATDPNYGNKIASVASVIGANIA